MLSALPSPSTAPRSAPAAAPIPAPLAVLSRSVPRVPLDWVPVVAHPNGVSTARHRRPVSQRLCMSFLTRHLQHHRAKSKAHATHDDASSNKNNLGVIDLLQSARPASDMRTIGTSVAALRCVVAIKSERWPQAGDFVRTACHS